MVRAGTGTGKTLGYLVPAIRSGRRVVVATATKALQDQLAAKDLPFLDRHLDQPFSWAILKGRSNYACVQRLAELARGPGAAEVGDQLALDGLAERADPDELAALAAWASTSPTGDRAELPVEPSDAAWSAVSTGSRDCPGAARCRAGRPVLRRGRSAGRRGRRGGGEPAPVRARPGRRRLLLPDHEVAVVDEAHQLDDIISATTGVELGPGRFTQLGRVLRGILAGADDTVAAVADAAGILIGTLVAHRDRRITAPLPTDLAGAWPWLGAGSRRPRPPCAIPEGVSDDVTNRAIRARQAASALLEDLDAVAAPGEEHVLFVTGPEHTPALRLAPLDVAKLLAERLWSRRTAVLTSATLAPGFGPHVQVAPGGGRAARRGQPLRLPHQRPHLLRGAAPRPTDPRWADAAVDELGTLIEAAGGRTLALFTSYKAMNQAAQDLRIRLPFPILAQGDLPKPALVDRFAREPETCLFATMSFWQGIDVPGPSLSLVTIDRLPFPRPDDPLLQARHRAGRCRRLHRHRRAPGGHAAGPGVRPADPHRLGPRRGSGARSSAGHCDLRAPDRGHPAPNAPHRDRAEIEAFLRELREAG